MLLRWRHGGLFHLRRSLQWNFHPCLVDDASAMEEMRMWSESAVQVGTIPYDTIIMLNHPSSKSNVIFHRLHCTYLGTCRQVRRYVLYVKSKKSKSVHPMIRSVIKARWYYHFSTALWTNAGINHGKGKGQSWNDRGLDRIGLPMYFSRYLGTTITSLRACNLPYVFTVCLEWIQLRIFCTARNVLDPHING